jgi:acyl carrier protein
MTDGDLTKLEATMRRWVSEQIRRNHTSPHEFTSDSNLIAQGLLDSVSFIELIALIEKETGLALKIEEIAHEDLTSITGLCRHLRTNLMTAR